MGTTDIHGEMATPQNEWKVNYYKQMPVLHEGYKADTDVIYPPLQVGDILKVPDDDASGIGGRDADDNSYWVKFKKEDVKTAGGV